ncbi:MAG: efflux RND transporter periplasmic adaptor subunit [Blastocatellia bacterium]|nr:efflux RND transporter periplasmic adaptor subunit [Blastocatellia bacterium]
MPTLSSRAKFGHWLLIGTAFTAVVAIPITLAFARLPNRTSLLVALPDLNSKKTLPQMVEVKAGQVTKTLHFDGELRAVRSRAVYSPSTVQAKITYLPPEGSIVKAGDKLAEFDQSSILAKIKDLSDKVVAAQNKIAETKSKHESELRTSEVDVSRSWLTLEKARVELRTYGSAPETVARRDLQQKQLNFDKAQTEYNALLARIDQKKREQQAEQQLNQIDLDKVSEQLRVAKESLKEMTINATSDGMVIYSVMNWGERRKIQVGDSVFFMPVLTVPDLNEMEILAEINEVDGPKLSPQMKTTVVLDSYPDREFTGLIKDISPTAVQASGARKTKIFKAVITLDKTESAIMKPGMSARISIPVGESGEQLLVPRAAMRFENGIPQVVRWENNAPRTLAVTILATDAVAYAVAANGALRSGDKVVVNGK